MAREGFASMDKKQRQAIASKGGKAAHQKGTAHKWTREEARKAGRKGGLASRRKTMAKATTDTTTTASAPTTDVA